MEIDTDEPSKLKIDPAIKSLKNDLAPGMTTYQPKSSKQAADILYPVFCKTWKNSVIPTTWSKVNIVKLPEKKEISQTVTTGEVLLYCLYQVRSFVK